MKQKRVLQLKPDRESIRGFAYWVVVEDHGKCGCGACDMIARVALFENRADAELFIEASNRNGLTH